MAGRFGRRRARARPYVTFGFFTGEWTALAVAAASLIIAGLSHPFCMLAATVKEVSLNDRLESLSEFLRSGRFGRSRRAGRRSGEAVLRVMPIPGGWAIWPDEEPPGAVVTDGGRRRFGVGRRRRGR